MSNYNYSDSYTSGDFKPSNYTDFSSSSYGSYNYDQDNSYKKFDQYSSNYSGFDSSSNNSQSTFTQFDSYENHKSSDYQKPSDRQQEYQNDSFSSQDSYFKNDLVKPVPTPIQPIQSNVMSQPFKPLQKYTVRDVLDLPLSRQQYLKSLSVQNLRSEPQYNVLRKRQSVVLGILDYYEKIIPDTQFNAQVKSLKKGKDIKETLWLTSIIGYLIMTGRLQSSGSSFKGVFKGRAHILIPFGLTALMIVDNRNTRAKTASLLRENKYSPSIDLALRKFICDTTQKQRIQIFGQS